MRLLAEIIIIMPVVASSTSTGYSKRCERSRFMKLTDKATATAEPNSAMIFITRAKVSTTKAPPKAVSRPSPPQITSAAARPSEISAPIVTLSVGSSLRKTPYMSSARLRTASAISGRTATASACWRSHMVNGPYCSEAVASDCAAAAASFKGLMRFSTETPKISRIGAG